MVALSQQHLEERTTDVRGTASMLSAGPRGDSSHWLYKQEY